MSRSHDHRWARINAIMEAAWQDNSCPDSDQAPIDATARNVTYDQRESLSPHGAVEWANAERCPVTFYLYDEGEGTT